MAMKVLVARHRDAGNGKDVVVTLTAHLDTTRMLVDGTTPDPAWCYSQSWQVPGRGRTGETAPQFRQRLDDWVAAVKPEFKATCKKVLDTMAETTLSIEGQTL